MLRPETLRLEAIGTGKAIRAATLHPEAAGTVVAVHARPDQRVARGDVLLDLDARADVARAIAGLYAAIGAPVESSEPQERSDMTTRPDRRAFLVVHHAAIWRWRAPPVR